MSAVEAWEARRACVNGRGKPWVDPNWFDVDASKDNRAMAAAVCQGCPVRTECKAKVYQDLKDGVSVNGFYAGQKWKTGERRDRSVPEERVCCAPNCFNTFMVTGANPNKRACSYGCSARARPARPPRLRRVKARNT